MKFFKEKESNENWIMYIIAATIISPLIISFFCWAVDFTPQIPFFKIGSNSDWIAFWGSVSGSILGVFGTYKVVHIQLETDKKKYEETQIDNTFFNMINLFQKLQENMGTGTSGNLLGEIRETKYNYKKTKIANEENQLIEDNLLKIINATTNLLKEKNISVTAKGELKYILNHKTSFGTTQKFFIVGFGEIFYKKLIKVESLSPAGVRRYKLLAKIYKEHGLVENKYNNYIFEEDEAFFIVDKTFFRFHSRVGAFLRMFHRIVKYVMESELSMKKKKEYLGVIRALLSSNEILVIFYNTFYTTRGKGLRKQLECRVENKKSNPKESTSEGTDFFADELDLEEFNNREPEGQVDLPFFRYEELIFGDSDLDKIKSLTNFK